MDFNYDPRLHKGWDRLSESVQNSVLEESTKMWGMKAHTSMMGRELVEEFEKYGDSWHDDDVEAFNDIKSLDC